MPSAAGDGLFLPLILDRVTRLGEGGDTGSQNLPGTPLPTFLLHPLPISPECLEAQRENQGSGPFPASQADIRHGLESPELTLFEFISSHPFLTLCFERVCLLFNASRAGCFPPVPPSALCPLLFCLDLGSHHPFLLLLNDSCQWETFV